MNDRTCPYCQTPLSRKPNESARVFAERRTCNRSCAQSLRQRNSKPPAEIPEPEPPRPSALGADATAEEAFLHDYEAQHAIHSWQRADAFSERLEALQTAFPAQDDRTLRRILCRYDLRSNGDDILREAVRWERPKKAVYSGVKKG